jgi:hypothetical protein
VKEEVEIEDERNTTHVAGYIHQVLYPSLAPAYSQQPESYTVPKHILSFTDNLEKGINEKVLSYSFVSKMLRPHK